MIKSKRRRKKIKLIPFSPRCIHKVMANESDVIVVSVEDILSMDRHQHMQHVLSQYFPNNKVLILQRGMDLSVITLDAIASVGMVAHGSH